MFEALSVLYHADDGSSNGYLCGGVCICTCATFTCSCTYDRQASGKWAAWCLSAVLAHHWHNTRGTHIPCSLAAQQQSTYAAQHLMWRALSSCAQAHLSHRQLHKSHARDFIQHSARSLRHRGQVLPATRPCSKGQHPWWLACIGSGSSVRQHLLVSSPRMHL